MVFLIGDQVKEKPKRTSMAISNSNFSISSSPSLEDDDAMVSGQCTPSEHERQLDIT